MVTIETFMLAFGLVVLIGVYWMHLQAREARRELERRRAELLIRQNQLDVLEKEQGGEDEDE